MSTNTTNLTWASAGTDNPGDQIADSALGGAYEVGPDHPSGWALTLVLRTRGGHVERELDLGRFVTEGDAKAAAVAHETANASTPDWIADFDSSNAVWIEDTDVPTSPSGLTADDECDDTCAVHAPDCDGYCDHGLGGVPHRNACLPDMTAPGQNSNCLDGIRCPRCGSEDAFEIQATCTVTVSDDGTDDAHSFGWDGASVITCTECRHTGTVEDFTITENA